jgi:DNA-binding CsgD family transcriptional regulator
MAYRVYRDYLGGAVHNMSHVETHSGDALIDRFGDETTRMICRALGAEWGTFYRIGRGQQPFGFRVHGIPREFGMAYDRLDMQHVDPLHPFQLLPRKHRFRTIGAARAENPTRYRDFVSFLRSHGAQDAAEMIFTCQGKAVAGLGILWTGRKPEHHSMVELGTTLHEYIEFNLGALWREAMRPDASVDAESAFTSREEEVIRVVCRGFTNEQIASQLNIAISTVKTHLINIFEKAGVRSRAELISRTLSTLAMRAQSPQTSN